MALTLPIVRVCRSYTEWAQWDGATQRPNWSVLAGRELYDRIGQKYRKDGEFRGHVDRFVSSFEELLGAASGRDRDNILVDTYLTSDTGKVYLILGQAIGKLS